MNVKPTALLLLMAALPIHAMQKETPSAKMPLIHGTDLNGKPWRAPEDFAVEGTLVILGFEENQQSAIDTWIEGLNLKNPTNRIAWVEMPVITTNNPIWKWFINTGMRGGIPDPATRAHVWTAYTDRTAFLKMCGIPTCAKIYALVVKRNGAILAVESGDYTKEGGARLQAAIR